MFFSLIPKGIIRPKIVGSNEDEAIFEWHNENKSLVVSFEGDGQCSGPEEIDLGQLPDDIRDYLVDNFSEKDI